MRQTAEIIAREGWGVPLILDDAVQELRAGEQADGMRLVDYTARYGPVDFDAETLRLVGPPASAWCCSCCGGDGAAEEHASKTILVVAHGVVVDASFLHFSGWRSRRLGF